LDEEKIKLGNFEKFIRLLYVIARRW